MSYTVHGVAWALLHPRDIDVTVVAVVNDILLYHRGGDWHGSMYPVRPVTDRMALKITDEAEATGMELALGPIDIGTISDGLSFPVMADKVMDALWDAQLARPRYNLQLALVKARTCITDPKRWPLALKMEL